MCLPLFTINFSVAVSGWRKSSASRNVPQITVEIRVFSLFKLSLILIVVPVHLNFFFFDNLRTICVTVWWNSFIASMCWIVHGIDRLMEITDDIFDVSIGWIVDSIDWFHLLHNVSIFSYSLWTFVWKLSPLPLKLSAKPYWGVFS